MSWADSLEMASFGGATFHCERVSDSLVRRWARYAYPYRDGVDVEDMGREPRETTITAVFAGPDYQSDLGALLLVVDDGEPATFTHPLFGSWQARANLTRIEHQHDRRDGCTVELQVLEVGTDTTSQTLFSLSRAKEELTTAMSATAAAVATLPAATLLEEIEAKVAEVVEVAAEMQSSIDAATTQVERSMNRLRSEVVAAQDKLRRAYTDNQAYQSIKALNLVAYRAFQMASRALAERPLSQVAQRAQGPLILAVYAAQGGLDRLAEAERLNRVRNPNRVPVGYSVVLRQGGAR